MRQDAECIYCVSSALSAYRKRRQLKKTASQSSSMTENSSSRASTGKTTDNTSSRASTGKTESMASVDVPEPFTVVEDKSAVRGKLIPGQLTVRRVPRVDIDALMTEGVTDMDVIWHSAADAADAILRGQNAVWKPRAPKRSGKKTTSARQRRQMQRQAAAGGGGDAPGAGEICSPGTTSPVDQPAVGSQSCRVDLLKHLLSSAPPPGVSCTMYECRPVVLFLHMPAALQ